MRRAFLVFAGLLLGNAVFGQETYQLRLKPRGVGESTLDLSTRVRISVKKWDTFGQQIGDELKVIKSRRACTITTLEMKGDKAVRERRHFTKATVNIDADERTEPFEGKTLLFIARDGGGHKVVTENGEALPEAIVAQLEQSASQFEGSPVTYQEMLPPHPVRVGESWNINAATWIKRDDIELRVARAHSTLTKVYRKDNRLFGVIETRVEVDLRSMTVIGRKLAMQPGSRIIMRSSMDACIDGTSTECVEQGTYLFTSIVRAPGPDGVDTKMDQEIEITHTQTTR